MTLQNKLRKALVLLASVMLVVSMSQSPAFAATAKEPVQDIHISCLAARTNISQMGLQSDLKKAGYRYVLLTWDSYGSVSPTKYVIYTSDKKKGTYTKLATVKEKYAKILLKKNQTTYIKVQGYKKKAGGHKSVWVYVKPGVSNTTRINFGNQAGVVFVGSKETIHAYPDGSVSKDVRWYSSDKNVFKVSKGVVTGVKPGTAILTAKAHNGIYTTQVVTVMHKYPQSISIKQGSALTLYKDKKKQLNAVLGPAYYMGVTWSTSNKAYVKVTKKGKITAVAPGSAVITATTEGGMKKTITVKVLSTAENMVLWAEKIARDNSYGYSMSVKRSAKKRVFNRYCYTCDSKHNSKDYDCASFVAAAVAHGYGNKKMKDWCAAGSGGCGSLKTKLISLGWKDMGKLKDSKLQRGDILINPNSHVEIYAGNGMNVGAHDDYNGKTGDGNGHEISISKNWHFYTTVLRLP